MREASTGIKELPALPTRGLEWLLDAPAGPSTESYVGDRFLLTIGSVATTSLEFVSEPLAGPWGVFQNLNCPCWDSGVGEWSCVL